MKTRTSHIRSFLLSLCLALLFSTSLFCNRSNPQGFQPWMVSGTDLPVEEQALITRTPFQPGAKAAAQPTPVTQVSIPTPDDPHPMRQLRSEAEQYTVKGGDTLGQIARRFQVSLNVIIEANDLQNPNLLSVGQGLWIPAPDPQNRGPSAKVIPDSELVYGPLSANFDIKGFINSQKGYLSGFSEEVDDRTLSGAQIVQRIALEYSVNPRLLLAVLEYRSGWVTQRDPDPASLDFPIVQAEAWRKGLYLQLAWAANNLNRGYYLWKAGAGDVWILADGMVIPISPVINAGTAGVQYFFSLLYGHEDWLTAVLETGLSQTYRNFFGNPFNMAVEPLIPPGLTQPTMQLPFEPGKQWAFTGGPHGGWADGSAWAAIDFAPPGDALGCVRSDEWVVAVADGPILRADNGAVIQDLDGDGLEQTGWVVLYMHVESRERVQAGDTVKAGERIGHPSCEGGVSTGTHLHLARRYNGEWIAADGDLPFVLDGWVSRGTGVEYDGFLDRDGQTVEAWEGYFPENSIGR